MPSDTRTKTTTEDPRQADREQPRKQQQPIPGSDKELSPRADHGEQSYRGTGRLKDMVAVITGADSGIGRAVAIAYAREGADVVISYLQEHQDAEETSHWVEQAGRKALRIPGDIQDEAHCRRIIDRTFEQFGRLDVLVNNAAFQVTHEQVEEWSSEEFSRAFQTNVFAMFYLCKAAMPRMKPGSSVINTASTGPVWTPLIPSTMPPEKVEQFGKNTSFGRPAQPAEIAPAYVFLTSEDARYMTGEVLGVTGGKMPF